MPTSFLALLSGIVSRRARAVPTLRRLAKARRHGQLLIVAALAVLGTIATPRPAAAGLELLTFTNATFTFIGLGAGSMTGSIEYHFDDSTGAATAAVMVDITKTSGCCLIGGGNYYFNAPGHTDNLTSTGVQFLTTSNLFHFVTSGGFDSTGTPNGSAELVLDVTGTGSSATIALFDPNNHSQITCSGKPGNGCVALATIGTNVGEDLAAPEPASLAVLGVGLAAVGVVRRRRLAAQVR